MRTQTFIVSMASALVFAGAANADFVLQTFSGSASASASVSRANTGVDVTGGLTLSYNAIAGGASSMDVSVYNFAYGSTKTTNANNPTTAVNAGTYSAGYTEGTGGNTKYYKNYYGGYTTSSPFTANNNYRAWDVNGNVGAQLQSSVINLSSSSLVDCGIADWTKIRYNSTYSSITSTAVIQKSDSADQVGTQGGSTFSYNTAVGQVMNLSSSTGFTGIQLQGSGIGWATAGQIGFHFEDAFGTRSDVLFNVTNSALMGNYLASVTDLQANATSDGVPGTAAGTLDFSQIKFFTIDFYDGQNYVSGSGATGNNSGFSYDASQVNLVGYAVPAPGAAALIGLAGLVASRRRRN
jgi:MYXO-CTERM domain-containing protein